MIYASRGLLGTHTIDSDVSTINLDLNFKLVLSAIRTHVYDHLLIMAALLRLLVI